jgi:phage tail-like protein
MPETELFPGFHFRVEFLGQGFPENDSRFQSVGGLEVSVDTESVREGGENRFEYALPVKTSYATLSLKRGVVRDSGVIDWLKETMESLQVKPLDVLVSLLDQDHQALMSWNVKHAWPRKWSVSELNAMNNELVVESLDLQYLYFTRS